MPSRNGDDSAYFNTAFNIEKFNVASHQVEEFRVHKHKNLIKPPLYSYLLSIFMNTEGKYENVKLECIYQEDTQELCFDFVQNSKKINLGIHFFQALILYLLIFILTKNNYLSFFGGFMILVSSYFLHTTNYFMTENLASILLLLHSVCLYNIFIKNKFRLFSFCLLSISLGLLILTKAIFLYWFYLLFIFFIICLFLRIFLKYIKLNSPNFIYYVEPKYIMISLILVVTLTFPWQFRNFIESGEFKISLQGGNVIAERAEYLKTDLQDIKYGIIFYIPSNKIKNLYKEKLNEKSFMFDESHPNSHYRNSDKHEKSYVLSKLEWDEKNEPDKVFQKSLELIKNEPIKHLYLSFMFFIRGIFQETIVNQYPVFIEYLSSITHWSSIIFLPIFFIFFIIKNDKKILLILPSIFTIISYSFLTDFEPRYGSVVVSVYVLILMKLFNDMLYKSLKYDKRKI